MINVIKISNHNASVAYDSEIDMFRGEFIGLNGGADFYATDLQTLKKEGEESLAFFLQTCKAKGIEPFKSYSGKISARLTPERHEALERIATTQGESINQLLNEGADLVIAHYA